MPAAPPPALNAIPDSKRLARQLMEAHGKRSDPTISAKPTQKLFEVPICGRQRFGDRQQGRPPDPKSTLIAPPRFSISTMRFDRNNRGSVLSMKVWPRALNFLRIMFSPKVVLFRK